ncbi:squamous cell carcinoma antigen recognized by T-cells 3 isoform X2 [Impatiens glandulifera]|uniref:squamous cell carcinoma antigen recognized by T-cells 3 isoform X2 n=1 Tax=Impatiens glandulifera TaxID=253017 RepID=UPI001FB0BFF2|nr:squamous cell carcinoma antigen recognized by T-cells 3 isoform X2 [Impatiens glandulifera]
MDETLEQNTVNQSTDEEMNDADKQSLPEDQNASSSSDTDSASDDDQVADEDLNLQISTLESELSSNPANYDAHVQYIKALRKIEDIVKLGIARQTMSQLFPLTPAMWQEWARDEITMNSGSEAFLAIEKLYERGIFDYPSVPLWCDYLEFVQEHDPTVRECSPSGVSKTRNLFERALVAAGLHMTEGSKIWEAYRDFEQAIVYTLDETDIEAREKQLHRVQSLFHRQMSVPHSGLKSTLLAYKSWLVQQGNALDADSDSLEGVSPDVASSYQKSMDVVNARMHFEDSISGKEETDVERLQGYMDYLKFEQSCGDPIRVQALYERAIMDFPISTTLWVDYTGYLDRTLKGAAIVRDVYSRATKNCPWVGDLWVRYLISLERARASEKEISSVFEKSLLCTFSTADEYLEIFLTRVDGLRRRISAGGELEDDLKFAKISDTFQRASEYLLVHLEDPSGLLRLHAYWARLEATLGKDLVAARKVWDDFLKVRGSVLEAWKGYIAMELELGNTREARSVYKRCYNKRFSGTGSEDICHSWLRFEREFGTLEDLEHAIRKTSPRLEELQLFKLQQDIKSIGTTKEQKEIPSKEKSGEKRKQDPNISDQQSKPKRQKNNDKKIKNLHGEGKNQNVVSLDAANKVDNKEAEGEKSSSSNIERKTDIAFGRSKHDDQCTAFVSNLDPKANPDDLQRFFSDVGKVVAIRILKDKFTGKSRGLAYVDFSNDAHLAAAVAKNKQKLFGKKLSIARSDPKQRRGKEPADQKKHGQDSSKAAEPHGESEGNNNNNNSVQFKGKSTFAVPRSIRALGWVDTGKKTEGGEDEEKPPQSNDEFRKMFIKK